MAHYRQYRADRHGKFQLLAFDAMPVSAPNKRRR